MTELYPDFFPWKKSKEEDALAVEYVQKGYSEPPVVTNEGSSERTTMVPLFKQWTSLPALQYFLFRSLEVREKNCRISTSSTFKPPPRVTLTDQKREAWLRDLASSTVPLRRLSRTIPHGIRGRMLLEQCCNKMIPISRAVWFIRCVGANELRGLKRRGNNASNMTESAWVHDWTEEVVEFIEKLVKEFGKEQEWKLKLEYMTRILAHLYHEELVNHGQVLRWCLRYFQKCKPEEVPVALVLVKMFWANLVESRALSQALAHAMLIQYSNISALTSINNNNNNNNNNKKGTNDSATDGNNDDNTTENHYTMTSTDSVYEALLSSIGDSMNKLFEVSSDSFVIPKQWRTLSPVLTEAIKDTPHAQEMLQIIRIRNESLIVSDAPLVRAHRNPSAVIVSELNKLKAPFSHLNFAQFVKIINPWRLEDEVVLKIIFEWASTNDKAFVTAHALCRYLEHHHRWNISGAFINYLTSLRNVRHASLEHIHDLVHEFVQSDMLSLDGYFRATIASGLLFIERLRPEVECQIMVLKNLYLDDFLPGYKVHRDMILRGIPLQYDRFDEAKELLQRVCDFAVGAADESSEDGTAGGGADYFDFKRSEIDLLTGLDKSSKVVLSQWLADGATTANNSVSSSIINDEDYVRPLNLSQFALLERVLLLLHGFRELYNVIGKMIPRVDSVAVLYFLASSVKDQLQVFSIFGNISELVKKFVIRYKVLNPNTMSKGLFDLVQFALTLDNHSLGPELRAELESMLKPATTASPMDISKLSPMSEISTESEYDLLLSSLGISPESADAKNTSKIFQVTAQKFLEACKEEKEGTTSQEGDTIRKLTRVMQYLRDVDLRVFNDLLNNWLRDQVVDLYYDRSAFLRVLLFLVIYECISLDKIADIFMQLKSVAEVGASSSASGSGGGGSRSTTIICTRLMIDLVSSEQIDTNLKAEEKLSLDFQRRTFESFHSSIYLRYIVQQIMDDDSGSATATSSVEIDWLNDTVTTFLLNESTKSIDTFIQIVVDPVFESQTLRAIQTLKSLMTKLVRADCVNSPMDDIISLIRVVNVFNFPLCQVAMRVYLKSLQEEPKASDILESAISPKVSSNDPYKDSEVVSFIVECALKAQSLDLSKQVVGDLMIYIDKPLKGQILLQVELVFLKSKQFPRVNYDHCNATSTLFEVVDAIADSATENLCSHYQAELTHCLDKLVELCENNNNNEEEDNQDRDGDGDVDMTTEQASIADIKDGILLFVKIAMIHCQSFTPDMLPLRDKLVNGLLLLLETSIGSSADLSGLLVDCLNTFKGEISDGQVSTPANATPKLASMPSASVRASPKVGNHLAAPHQPGTPTAQQHALNHQPQALSRSAMSSTSSYLNGLMVWDKGTESYGEVSVRSFDLLEDSNPTMGLNDVPLNLSMFDCTIDKSNPT